MSVPHPPRAGRRLLAAALIALAALLAAATSALGLTLPAPQEGDLRGPMLVERDAEGGAVVTWGRYSQAERASRPRAATFRPGEGWAWAEPETVSAAALWTVSEPGQGLAVGTNPAGDALAIWRLDGAIRVAARPAGGAYGVPQTLAPTSGEGPPELAIGLGAGGQALALWTVRTGEPDAPVAFARRTVWAADRAPDGTWSAPYVLAGPDARHSLLTCGGCPDTNMRPAVAVDAAGNAVAAWTSHREPAGTAVLWAQRPAGGAWSAPAVLSEPAGPDVALAVDPAGTVVATWMEYGWLHSAARPAGGAFGSAAHLGPVAAYASGLSRTPHALTMDGQGRALAVWVADGRRILAALRLTGGAWTEPADLAALTKPVEPPKPGPPGPPSADPSPTGALLRGVKLSHARLPAPACARRRSSARRPCRAAGLVLGFRLQAAGEVRVTIQRRGGRQVLRAARITAGAGTHRVRLLASRPLPAGRYTVRVRATADGWTPKATTRALLVVGRR